jgi:adenosylhomocysteinase
VERLIKNAKNTRKERHNIVGYQMDNNNWIYLLAEGRLVNLAAGDGHPAEIMDMSFAIQALSAEYLVKNNKGTLSNSVIAVPDEIDNMVARRLLKYWNVEIDKLTEDQEKYLDGWKID